jgi:hypothetical protein
VAVRPYDRTASRETNENIISPTFCDIGMCCSPFEGLERGKFGRLSIMGVYLESVAMSLTDTIDKSSGLLEWVIIIVTEVDNIHRYLIRPTTHPNQLASHDFTKTSSDLSTAHTTNEIHQHVSQHESFEMSSLLHP